MSRAGLAVIAILALTGGACASRRINRENAAQLAAADARVLQGCYDCLLQARDTYASLAKTTKGKARDSVHLRLFETQLLLALREKELALDPAASMDSARALIPRLAATLEPLRIIRMVDAVVPEATGRPEAVPLWRRAKSAYIPTIAAEQVWLSTLPLRAVFQDYLALALGCSYTDEKRPQLAPSAPPIIAYRTGICHGTDTIMVGNALRSVPAFHEAAYYFGSALAFHVEDTGGEDALRLLGQAYRRFPNSPVVTFVSGWFNSQAGDCPAAVRYFDETLTIDSRHELALLERTICLSRLQQDSAAIASATRLIALEGETLGQGFYWRAVSRYRQKELDMARSDIGIAKLRAMGPNSLTLAGIIEYEQDDLNFAEFDLRAARGLVHGNENCTAAWYLALVLNKKQQPREAAEQFEQSMTCHDIKVADIRSAIARFEERSTIYPARAAHYSRRIARLAADSVDERTRYYASAFNAAGNHANAGNRARALELLDVAARDPKLAEQVGKLREAIRGTFTRR